MLYLSEPHQYIIKIKKRVSSSRKGKNRFNIKNLGYYYYSTNGTQNQEKRFPSCLFLPVSCPCKRGVQTAARRRPRPGLLVIVHKQVPQELVGRRPQLGLHKDPFEEIASVVWDVSGKLGVCWLGGNFKDGSHRFKFGPRRLFSEHFHHSAAHTPTKEWWQDVTSTGLPREQAGPLHVGHRSGVLSHLSGARSQVQFH